MKRSVLLVSAAVAVTAPLAAATSLGGITGGRVGAGEAAIAACDSGFTVSYTTVGGSVSTVTVGDIAAVCAGGVLRLTVTDATGASIGAGGPQTLGATGSASVPVAPQPAAGAVAGVDVSITEP